MIRGIEAAAWGTVSNDVELKMSKAGKPFATINVAVVTDRAADGAEITTWISVAVFGETAEKIAAVAKNGSRIYFEGALHLETWQAADGQQRSGLSCSAWKVVPLGQIGEKRPRRPSTPADNGAAKKGGHEFNDPLPF